MADDERDPVEELAADYAERLRRGERPTIADYQARHPLHAHAIAELFPTIAALENIREESSADEVLAASSMPEQLGEFRIVQELGRGGMGVVYLAEQPTLDRRVAIKVLPQSVCGDDHARSRFQREARLAASIAHPGIVPIHAVGEDHGVPWFAMQLVDGVGLDRVIEVLASGSLPDPDGLGLAGVVRRLRDGRPPLLGHHDERMMDFYRSAALLIADAADALHHAHRQGILHRDLKPSNLLVDVDGRIWMSDFGLAKVLGDARMTSASGLTGTLRYLAPERFDGITDARSDLYGLGLVLYELVVWKPAFAGSSRSGLIEAILHQGIPRPRSRSAPLPPALVDIIMQACARRPASRQPDAAVLAAQLRRFAATVPSSATIHTADVNLTYRSRRPVVMAALVAALSAAIVTTLVVLPPPPRPPPPRDRETTAPIPSAVIPNHPLPEIEPASASGSSLSQPQHPVSVEPIAELEILAVPALKPMPADWPPRDQVVDPGTPRAQPSEMPPLEHPIPRRPPPRQDGEPLDGPPPGPPGWRPPRDAPPPGERGRRPPPRF